MFLNRLILLSLVSSSIAVIDYYHTLLYGEKLKGFIKISELKDDNFLVSFDISKGSVDNVKWALHMSSAPYDMTIMTDNCKRVKKSPHMMRDLTLEPKTVPGNLLHGHTIVLNHNDEVLACATVILPNKQLLSASFHAEVLEGHIHVVRMSDNHARLLPDLRYHSFIDEETLYKQIILWSFVDDCNDSNTTQISDGTEIGIDSRTTITVEVNNDYSLGNLALYSEGEMFACIPLEEVEPRVLMSVNLTLIQRNHYEPVYAGSEPFPETLHIRDDCLDYSTESVHHIYNNYYPSVTIFGSESIILKSLNQNDLCSVLRPHFPRPASTTYFMNPIVGRVTIVDTEDEILVTGELRHLLESSSTRATIQFSAKEIGENECNENVVCVDCKEIVDAAIIVGKEDKTVSLSGVITWFDITTVRSAIIDLQWTKICANMTYLPNGSLSAHALLKSLTTTSSKTVASIVAMEYPANNYTEVIVNKRQPFDSAQAHSRPIDMSVTTGHPCGDQNIGTAKPVFWAPRLAQILASPLNDTSVFIWFNMITGPHSVLGTSVLLADNNKVFCGDFQPLTEKAVASASFNDSFTGYIKLTQYMASNYASGMPTQGYYFLRRGSYLNRQLTNRPIAEENIFWDIVKENFSSCDTAAIYNPFEVEDACSAETVDACPLGNTTAKSELLSSGSRKHILIKDLPLTGPYSVVGKYLRIRSMMNESQVECKPIVALSEAIFRWQVKTGLSLSDVQSGFAKAVNLPEYQIEVDYTREPTQPNCIIYNINLLAEDSLISSVQDSFDREKNHFKQAQKYILDEMRILMLLISLGQPLYTACDPLCENGIIMYAANRSLQYLTTPNYEKGFLPHNFTCSLVIKSIDSSRVWINIEELDMEFQVFDGCLDHITVLNTSSRVSKKEDRLAILCGLVNNISFVSNTEYMRVEVFTDMVISSRGARIAYRSLPDDECDDGWHEYKTKCFYLSPDTSEYSWAEAQNACVKQQSNLASVSQWIAYQDALLWLEGLNLTQSVWLGLSDIAREGYFSGLDGSHDFPFNWGSPNTFQNNDVNDCVYVNMSLTNVSDGDMFQLSDCRERRMFLCEKNKHGITWTAPDQTDSVRSAAQSWNFDFAFWILFFLTILLIILICSACALALKRHQRQSRVSATDDTTARAPVNTRSTTHSDPVGTVRAVNQDVPRNLPKPPESRRNIAVDTEANADVEQVVHQQTVVTPKEVISTARERLGVEDTSPNMEIPKGMIYVQSKNNIQKLNLNPSNLDGLQSRERTMMTMQTRDESFMRSKRAGDMFGRPKMTVLDNISAISLDEFWSNQSNIDQHDKNK